MAIQLIIDSSLKIQIQQTHQNPLPPQEIPSHHQSGDSLPQKCLQRVNENAYLPMATGVYVPKPVRVKSNYTQALQHQMPPLKHHCHKASPNDTESIFQLSVVHMARGCLMEPSGQFSHFHLVYFLVAVLLACLQVGGNFFGFFLSLSRFLEHLEQFVSQSLLWDYIRLTCVKSNQNTTKRKTLVWVLQFRIK